MPLLQKHDMVPDGNGTNRWCVTRKIGEGQFAEVYEVKDYSCSGDKFAIKIEKKAKILKTEHKVLSKLQHVPQVCKLYNQGLVDDKFFIVLELLGQNLVEYRKQAGTAGKLDADIMKVVGLSMLQALEGVHKAGYIHRDVKPANFAAYPRTATGQDGVWHLIDFGLARKHLENGEVIPARVEAAFRGSTTYASVNTHLGQDQGRRDDLWSWMYILIELVEGNLPWRADVHQIEREGEKDPLKDKEIVLKKKQQYIKYPNDLASNGTLDESLVKISNYLAGLEYSDEPNYVYLKECLGFKPSEQQSQRGVLPTGSSPRPMTSLANGQMTSLGPRTTHIGLVPSSMPAAAPPPATSSRPRSPAPSQPPLSTTAAPSGLPQAAADTAQPSTAEEDNDNGASDEAATAEADAPVPEATTDGTSGGGNQGGAANGNASSAAAAEGAAEGATEDASGGPASPSKATAAGGGGTANGVSRSPRVKAEPSQAGQTGPSAPVGAPAAAAERSTAAKGPGPTSKHVGDGKGVKSKDSGGATGSGQPAGPAKSANPKENGSIFLRSKKRSPQDQLGPEVKKTASAPAGGAQSPAKAALAAMKSKPVLSPTMKATTKVATSPATDASLPNKSMMRKDSTAPNPHKTKELEVKRKRLDEPFAEESLAAQRPRRVNAGKREDRDKDVYAKTTLSTSPKAMAKGTAPMSKALPTAAAGAKSPTASPSGKHVHVPGKLGEKVVSRAAKPGVLKAPHSLLHVGRAEYVAHADLAVTAFRKALKEPGNLKAHRALDFIRSASPQDAFLLMGSVFQSMRDNSDPLALAFAAQWLEDLSSFATDTAQQCRMRHAAAVAAHIQPPPPPKEKPSKSSAKV